MATFTTPNYDAQNESRVNTSRLAAPNVASGQVEFATIPYTIAGTEATNDVINLGLLPAGVIPMPQLSKVTCSADPGTTLVVDIGTAEDLDGWCDGAVLSNGGQVECNTPATPAWQAATQIAADTGSGNAVVKATLASVSTLTAGVILYFTLAYKRGR